MPAKPKVETFSINVDGRAVEARKGEMIIAAAERGGTYIPRFCWHPRMKPVGMCRMCVVDVKGPRGWGLIPACYVPVAPDMEVNTQSPRVKKAQDGILEFLLINHPLDCPVCDKGGECPLQDHTLAFGPGESRMEEEKRHFEKPVPISDLVLLDRERCIMCARCTRFADEVAGDPFIQILDRGNGSQINVFPDDPFASYFSGNTVQICPVGALTAAPYRFKARPWDLDQVESTCTVCAVGCRVALQSSSNRLTRMLGLDSEPVNHGWLCDKGRFSIGAVNSENRLTTPLVRRDGALVETTWGEALDAAAEGLAAARQLHGADTLAVLGGARLADEDAYAWAKLAKGVLGTDSVDCQLGDGLPAEVVLGLPRATIDQATWADTVVLLGPDLREELPVLFLRLRQAAEENGVKLLELTSHGTGLTGHAVSLLHQPGAGGSVMAALLAEAEPNEAVAGVPAEALKQGRALLGPDRSVVVVLGRPSLSESADHTVSAALALHEARPEARFLPALRRGNVHGALELGLAPGVLPGATSLQDGAGRFAEAWGSVPPAAGRDATGTLLAASEGRVHGLVLLGADPLTDHPDRWLARRGLSGAGFVVAVDAFRTPSVEQADVVLPVAVWGERPGTTTNVEGRVTRLGQKVVPPGVAWADWMVASELAISLGADLGLESLAAIAEEIERLAPSRSGLTRVAVEDPVNRDGLVALAGQDAAAPGPGGVEGIEPNEDPGAGAVERHAAESGAPAGSAATSGDPGATVTVAPPRAAAPRLRPPPARAPAPVKPDAYKLRLVTSRTLYDGGTVVQESDLAKLAPTPTLHVHPSDLNRFSLVDGGLVKVTSSRFTTTVPASADPGLPRGACWLAFNLGAPGAADLIDASEPVTDVAVEGA